MHFNYTNMMQKRILVMVATAIITLVSSQYIYAETKQVHINGTHKTLQLSPNGLWVLDCGTQEIYGTLVNVVHTINLHFDKPTSSNPFDIDCDKSYGEMDFSDPRYVYQYVIIDVEPLGNNKYKIKSKNNRDEDDRIDTDILTFEPITNTICLNDGDPFWSMGGQSYPDGILAEITGDNVNFRSGPGTNYPPAQFPYNSYSYEGEKYTGGCAIFKGHNSMQVIILPEFENPDWYRIAIPNVSEDTFNYVWVSKKYCKPIMSDGLDHKQPKEIYVRANNDEPEDDELGCWQPSIELIFVFDNNMCCKIDSYQSSVYWGYYYPDQKYINFFMYSMADFKSGRESGLSVNVGKETVTFDVSKGSSIASFGIPEAKDWGYLPCLSVFDGKQISKIFNDVLKEKNRQGAFEILLKEDLDQYNYYSVGIH